MKASRLLRILLLLAVLAAVAYSYVGSQPAPVPYAVPLRRERQQKDADFRHSPESPLPVEQRENFAGLRYYAPDSTAVVVARLTRFARPAPLALATSTRQTELYLRWGEATFTLPASSTPLKLSLFRKASQLDSTLFVPFTDAGNGHDTYGGGRFLDLRLPAPDAREITLDFNRAYNPFCAYNNDYSCPVPPAENQLKVVVAAGEKSFHD